MRGKYWFCRGRGRRFICPGYKKCGCFIDQRNLKTGKKSGGCAREGKIKPDDCKGATFTISNMGMYDVFTFNPIINQPESGILGITGIEDVLKMRDGNVVGSAGSGCFV